MAHGIAILGLNGSGKSTLNHMLARELGYFEMDVEDYYFPEQKAHRLLALERDLPPGMPQDTAPYSAGREQEDVEAALLRDMTAHPRFVLSCVKLNWCDALLRRIDAAFVLQVPPETRLARIRSREEKRFGARALPGGDMYARQEAFRALVMQRDPACVTQSAAKLRCPVVTLDGALPPAENLAAMLAFLDQLR